MNNNNFNASGLETIIKKLNGLRHGFNMLAGAARGVSKEYGGAETPGDDIIEIVKSEDSDLAQTWRNTIDISGEIVSKSHKLLDRIEEELNKYVKETIRNEYNASEAISNINGSLESSKEALSQLEF